MGSLTILPILFYNKMRLIIFVRLHDIVHDLSYLSKWQVALQCRPIDDDPLFLNKYGTTRSLYRSVIYVTVKF